jgi:hypothetical protein
VEKHAGEAAVLAVFFVEFAIAGGAGFDLFAVFYSDQGDAAELCSAGLALRFCHGNQGVKGTVGYLCLPNLKAFLWVK